MERHTQDYQLQSGPLTPEDGKAWQVRVVPRGAIDLVLALGDSQVEYRQDGPAGVSSVAGAFVIGPSSRWVSAQVRATGTAVVVRIGLGKATALLNCAPSELRDRAVEVAAMDGTFARQLVDASQGPSDGIEQRLHGILSRRIDGAGPSELHPVLAELFRARGAITAGELARRSAMSPRKLQRLFDATLGLSPSACIGLARIRAARTALAHPGGGSLCELAGALGYFDQAHFTNHFRSVCGVPPGRGRSVVDVVFFQDQAPAEDVQASPHRLSVHDTT